MPIRDELRQAGDARLGVVEPLSRFIEFNVVAPSLASEGDGDLFAEEGDALG